MSGTQRRVEGREQRVRRVLSLRVARFRRARLPARIAARRPGRRITSPTRQRGGDAESQGSRGPYVLLCDARKQSAAAWVDRQAALGTQDAGPVLSPGGLLEGSGGLLSSGPPVQVSSPFPIREGWTATHSLHTTNHTPIYAPSIPPRMLHQHGFRLGVARSERRVGGHRSAALVVPWAVGVLPPQKRAA